MVNEGEGGEMVGGGRMGSGDAPAGGGATESRTPKFRMRRRAMWLARMRDRRRTKLVTSSGRRAGAGRLRGSERMLMARRRRRRGGRGGGGRWKRGE